MDNYRIKKQKLARRQKRVRAKIFGTDGRPRFSVFRSNKHIYVQLIDDEKHKTVLSVSDLDLKKEKKELMKGKSGEVKELSGKKLIAYSVGKLAAKQALAKKINKVVFDRGGYKYHGRVKAIAEGARAGGLEF